MKKNIMSSRAITKKCRYLTFHQLPLSPLSLGSKTTMPAADELFNGLSYADKVAPRNNSIKKRYAGGETQQAIADDVGLVQSSVNDILSENTGNQKKPIKQRNRLTINPNWSATPFTSFTLIQNNNTGKGGGVDVSKVIVKNY